MAFADAKVQEHTDGKEVVKIVVVPKRLVNIVVKGENDKIEELFRNHRELSRFSLRFLSCRIEKNLKS